MVVHVRRHHRVAVLAAADPVIVLPPGEAGGRKVCGVHQVAQPFHLTLHVPHHVHLAGDGVHLLGYSHHLVHVPGNILHVLDFPGHFLQLLHVLVDVPHQLQPPRDVFHLVAWHGSAGYVPDLRHLDRDVPDLVHSPGYVGGHLRIIRVFPVRGIRGGGFHHVHVLGDVPHQHLDVPELVRERVDADDQLEVVRDLFQPEALVARDERVERLFGGEGVLPEEVAHGCALLVHADKPEGVIGDASGGALGPHHAVTLPGLVRGDALARAEPHNRWSRRLVLAGLHPAQMLRIDPR
mmetsp:Transcript_58313/g.164638  ORF Transcript_58313/g.164638 Transcript_58313/m.164638 type:complete len:294 (+) Transcript_58313:634-1515(+)